MNSIADFVADLLRSMEQVDPVVVGLVLLVLLALEGSLLVGLFIPADAIILICGMALDGALQVTGVAAGGVLGCYLGASGGYLLGTRYGRRLRHGRGHGPRAERRWRRAEELVTGRGAGVALAIAYFLPVAHALTPVLAGTLGMPYRRFVSRAMIGGTVWVTTYLTIGSMAGSAARDHQGLVIPLVTAAAALAASIAFAARRLGARRPAGRTEPDENRPSARASR